MKQGKGREGTGNSGKMPANILKIGSLTFPAIPHARIQSGSLFIQSNFTSFLFLYCLHSHRVMKMRKVVQLSRPYLTILSSRKMGLGLGVERVPPGGQSLQSFLMTANWKSHHPLPGSGLQNGSKEVGGHHYLIVPTSRASFSVTQKALCWCLANV